MRLAKKQLTNISRDPKAFLNRAYRTNERITAKRERIESWRQLAESITAPINDMPSGGSGPSKLVETSVCNIVDLQNELKDEIWELVETQREIGFAIQELVDDPTHKTLLELRYLNYLKWEEIAVRLNITFRWTMTLHKRALKEISSKAL